jgi:type I restriction enzyme M protein
MAFWVKKSLDVQQRFVNASNRLEDLKRMMNAATMTAADCLNAATRSAFLSDGAEDSNAQTASKESAA